MARSISMLAAVLIASSRLLAGDPTTQPAPPAKLPEQFGYAFDAIDPAWSMDVLYIDPTTGKGILPTDPGDKSGLGRIVNYATAPNGRSRKELVYSPQGRVTSETDLKMTSSYPARGDIYLRLFDEKGELCLFLHQHDMLYVEGFSRSADGKVEHVRQGAGSLTMANSEGKITRRFFGDGGQELVLHLDDKLMFIDSTGSLTRDKDGSETVSLRAGDQPVSEWQSTSPADAHGAPGTPPITFARARELFLRHYLRSVEQAGFSLKEMEVPEIESPTTAPASR